MRDKRNPDDGDTTMSKPYALRVHFTGDFGPGISEDVQMRTAWGRSAKEAASDFLMGADRCWIEVLSADGKRVIHVNDGY